ncbi:MAG: hypothetical protein GX644_03940 [Limnobacter sp.]|nr:hypothetical protein [Limnobacter sp.]
MTTGHESLRVDAFPIDAELQDIGTTGPELAWLARSYCESPRALVFRNPSPDWRLFALTLPLASRLSLMANPIFGQLTRAWAMNVRFIGVDRDGLVHDFRALLSDRTLSLLVELLARSETSGSDAGDAADTDGAPGTGARALDLLFDALAREMLTVLELQGDDWPRHLAREHRLEPGVAQSLFDHAGRYPDFLAKLREALRNQVIDVEFYGRVLRSIDLREAAVDARISALIESALDPVTLAKLARTPAGKHLGCYNWLRIEPQRAVQRAYLLTRLPSFATFFAEAMLPSTLSGQDGGRRPFDLRRLAARSDSAHSLHWAGMLRRAVDAGQDRATIESIAQRFAVDDNVIRRIWREQPDALGQPPTWHLAQILRRLDALSHRDWPEDEPGWRRLIADAVPAEAL